MDFKSISFPLRVAKRIAETPDAVSFILDVPTELQRKFVYSPGQFVTLFIQLDGQVFPRSYSIGSSPITDKEMKITVKKITGGRASPVLVETVKAGDTVWVTPPAGNFFRRPQSFDPVHYIMFAAGSGITPIFSIIKTVLAASQQDRVTLIFSNRNQCSIIYANEVNDLEEKWPGRFKVVHILTQPAPEWTGLVGRCDSKIVRDVVTPLLHDNFEVYLCGPDGFMDSVRSTLSAMGIAKEKIHQESFVSAPALGAHASSPLTGSKTDEDPAGRVYIGQGPKEIPSEVELTALIGGEEVKVKGSADKTVLELLLEAGANAPYSCMEGACMACLAKIRDGLVYQNDPGILSDENIASGDVLTCQAKAASAVVRLDYDSL